MGKNIPAEIISYKIKKNDEKYGILTLGSKSELNLPVDQEIQIAFNRTIYEERVRTHKTTKGRIDGLTGFFRKHHLDLFATAEVDVSYDSEKEILHLHS